METGFGIEPIANLAQLPNGVEARGRRQPTQPVVKNLIILKYPEVSRRLGHKLQCPRRLPGAMNVENFVTIPVPASLKIKPSLPSGQSLHPVLL